MPLDSQFPKESLIQRNTTEYRSFFLKVLKPCLLEVIHRTWPIGNQDAQTIASRETIDRAVRCGAVEQHLPQPKLTLVNLVSAGESLLTSSINIEQSSDITDIEHHIITDGRFSLQINFFFSIPVAIKYYVICVDLN